MISGGFRSWLRRLHLYVGLWFGAIFALSGLTGSAIAWMHEIDSLLNPELFRAAPVAPTPARAQAVIDRLVADARYGRPTQLILPQRQDDVFVAWYRQPKTAASPWSAEISRQVMVDGMTLQVTGERNWGQFGLSRRLLMPTVFHVHRYLLAGEVGKTLIGVSGLALMVTSLAGIVLWWPAQRSQPLRRALRVSYAGSWKRLAYTAHRTAGVAALPVLAFLGFSGLYFNLPTWVVPVVASVAQVSPTAKPTNQSSHGLPMAPAQAMEIAQARYPQGRISRVLLPANASAPYEIRLRQPGEIRQGDGATRISIDAHDGAVLRVMDPLHGPAGDKFLGWLFPLHSGEALGTPGRVFVTGFGLMPPLFFATGFLIWAARRRKRRLPPVSPTSTPLDSSCCKPC
jgi:uncharacterized iron-regulated membrane protein